MVPSIVGHPKNESLAGTYVGRDALDNKGDLTLTYPVDRGIVQNWDDMENVWRYMFSTGLKISPSDHSVLMVESPESNINKKNRNKIYEVMFETFQVAGMQVAIDSVLSLYASGRKTGIVCTCGDALSHILPIYEGFQLPEAMISLNLGGRDVTEFLDRILEEKGYSFTFENRSALLNEVKEKYAYVALDFEKEMTKSPSEMQQKHTFADGYEILLDQERFRCTEPIFQPSLIGIQSTGLDDLVFKSIMKCDMDVRRDLYHNVVMAGGTTMIPGFIERIKQGIAARAPSTMDVQVSAPPDRAISAWVGGSILASSANFHQQLLSLQQYQECGLDNIPLSSGIF